jgi:hypothetical protein
MNISILYMLHGYVILFNILIIKLNKMKMFIDSISSDQTI